MPPCENHQTHVISGQNQFWIDASSERVVWQCVRLGCFVSVKRGEDIVDIERG